MYKKWKAVLVVAVVSSAFLLSGCFFNIFQTAKTVGAGNVALTIGSGLFDFQVDDDHNWSITPQARISFGLSDKVDLGFQTGAMISLETGNPAWLGAIGDLKFSLLDDPDSFSLAFGFGGGSASELAGWGAFLEIFFDSNVKALPIFISYRPLFPFNAGTFTVWHHLAGGLRLKLSDAAVLLIEVDTFGRMISFGLALEVTF